MEVSNSTEAVGYIASPNDFQKYGRPFEDDPIDDAKALLASLTYGRTRSSYIRGNITMPDALLRALIAGREIGKNGVRAIGEDYRELEARQVVKVTARGGDRYTMKLLKKDVGELALTIVHGGARRAGGHPSRRVWDSSDNASPAPAGGPSVIALQMAASHIQSGSLRGHVRISVDEKEDPIPSAGVAGVKATPVKRVPPILDRHKAETVCGIKRSQAIF